MIECPLCGSPDIYLFDYDYGIDNETGYHDHGLRFQCRECKEEGNYENERNDNNRSEEIS